MSRKGNVNLGQDMAKADNANWLSVDARLLLHLAHRRIEYILARVDIAARELPIIVPADLLLDCQYFITFLIQCNRTTANISGWIIGNAIRLPLGQPLDQDDLVALCMGTVEAITQ